MVLGSGLMASAFAAFANDNRYRVIAAGVSNSREKHEAAFARERRMIEDLPAAGGRVVYLGTCSVFDPTLLRSHYLEHKREMEELVLSYFSEAMVLRLPNVLARSANPHTLLNSFRDRILHGAPIDIQMDACRYVMDVRDLTRVAPLLLNEPRFIGKAINVCYDEPIPVHRLLAYLEEVLGRKAVAREVAGGMRYAVANDEFSEVLHVNGIPQPDEAELLKSVRHHYAQDSIVHRASHDR